MKVTLLAVVALSIAACAGSPKSPADEEKSAPRGGSAAPDSSPHNTCDIDNPSCPDGTKCVAPPDIPTRTGTCR